MLDPKLCLSVVGTSQILDIQATSLEMALLWVRGLRGLLGQSEEESEKLAEKNLKSGNLASISKGLGPSQANMPAVKSSDRLRAQELIKLQQDLFVMTTHTVFRSLQEEGIWEIDESVKEKFNAKIMYEQALKLDVPWRQWNHWLRKQIVDDLKQRKMHRYSNFSNVYNYNYQAQQPWQPPMQPFQPQPLNMWQQPPAQPMRMVGNNFNPQQQQHPWQVQPQHQPLRRLDLSHTQMQEPEYFVTGSLGMPQMQQQPQPTMAESFAQVGNWWQQQNQMQSKQKQQPLQQKPQRYQQQNGGITSNLNGGFASKADATQTKTNLTNPADIDCTLM